MSSPETQQAYAQGYHVGYQHGLEAGGGGGQFPPEYPVSLVMQYPERSSRALMFFFPFKPLLLVPHMIVLWFLSIAAGLVMLVAWFAVVIMGSYPRSLWDFMAGITRWTVRVQAWMLGLTDKYPPFSLK